MNTVYNDRQQELNLRTDISVFIIGCGGIGAWVALELVLAGVSNIKLADPDLLELHNLNRLPYPIDSVGTPKVIALSKLLHSVRSIDELEVTTIQEAITPNLLNVIHNNEVIIDCTDNIDTQKAIYKWAKDNGVEYHRAGVNTNHITITSTVTPWSVKKAEPDVCGVTIPAWVAPCVLAASLVVAKVLKYPTMEKSFDLENI